MKYLRCLCLLLALLLLAGCGADQESGENAVKFYYLQAQIGYSSEDSVITWEHRSDNGTLYETLTLYLQGPLSDELTSPFPAGTSLVEIDEEDQVLNLKLNARLATLTGMELTLACTCLAKTCFAMTDAREVRISANDTLLDGVKYITITTDSLLLTDSSAG